MLRKLTTDFYDTPNNQEKSQPKKRPHVTLVNQQEWRNYSFNHGYEMVISKYGK